MKRFLTKEFEDSNIGVYLASPYTHSSKDIMRQRYKTITHVSAHLSKRGIPHFTPITQSHVEQKVKPDLPHKWEYWKRVDELMVERMDELWICLMSGIDKSTGVKAEFEIALKKKKPVKLIAYCKNDGYILLTVKRWASVLKCLDKEGQINKRIVENHEE